MRKCKYDEEKWTILWQLNRLNSISDMSHIYYSG